MARLINANYFRLGPYRKWTSSWTAEGKKYRIYLKEDFLLSRFIKHFCNNYGMPLFTYDERRWKIVEDFHLEPESQKEVVNDNSFRLYHIGLYFSHVRIHRKGSILQIDIYFMDAKLENKRLSTPWSSESISSTIFQSPLMAVHPSRYSEAFIQLIMTCLTLLDKSEDVLKILGGKRRIT